MLRRGTWPAFLLVAACNFEQGSLRDPTVMDDGGSTIDIDAPMADARVDTPPGQTCFGSAGGLLVQCYDPSMLPMGTYQPASGTINTGTNSNCDRIVPQQPGMPELCIKHADKVAMSNNVRYVGPRAMVLLAVDSITVSGSIDVSSIDTTAGAGFGLGPCSNGSDGGDENNNGSSKGGGGAGGGGFGTGGGGGGSGTQGGGGGGGSTALTAIRGGCRGGDGGDSPGGSPGPGGRGGGAIYLIAKNSIAVPGQIRANGARGQGGGDRCGGGGGGSGGLIGLDSPVITVAGQVYANGGGGGEGGGGGNGGEDGSESTAWDQRGAGGNNNSNGGDGGGGSVANTSGQTGGSQGTAGGGGGGGAGRVKVYPPRSVPGKISPPTT